MVAETGRKGRLSPHQGAWLCFLALICPPLTAGILEGYNGVLAINILLTLFGWIPGMIHAYYVVGRHVAAFPLEYDSESGAAGGGGGGGTAVRIIHKLERAESPQALAEAEAEAQSQLQTPHGSQGVGRGRRAGDRTVEYEYVIEVGGQRYVRAPRGGNGVASQAREPERITITHQPTTTTASTTPVRSGAAGAGGGGSGVTSPRSPREFGRADGSHSSSAPGSQQGLMSPVRSEGGGVYSYGQALAGGYEPTPAHHHDTAPAYESQHGHGHGCVRGHDHAHEHEYQYGQKGERKDGDWK